MGFFQTWRAGNRFREIRRAIDANDPEEVERLLSAMKGDGLLDERPADLLLHACDEGGRPRCVRALLNHGWKSVLEAKDGMGRNALILAVERGDGDTARILLEAGADPNVRDQDGVTPLNLCKSYHGLSHIAEMLLKAGGNPNLVDKHGKNYLM